MRRVMNISGGGGVGGSTSQQHLQASPPHQSEVGNISGGGGVGGSTSQQQLQASPSHQSEVGNISGSVPQQPEVGNMSEMEEKKCSTKECFITNNTQFLEIVLNFGHLCQEVYLVSGGSISTSSQNLHLPSVQVGFFRQ